MNEKTGKKLTSIGLVAIIALSMFAAIATPASAATKEEIQEAVDDGVAWLAAQQNPDGSWGDLYSPVAKTAFAVKKLEHYAVDTKYGYGLDSPFDPAYPYADNVTRGLNYLFANANTINISVQPAGDPDTNGNGIGVYFVSAGGYHSTYETGIALMAIVESTTPDRVVDVPGSPVDGWTYEDVAQDTVDYLAWGQTDSGYGRGGWNYAEMDNAGDRSDNSNTGYAVLGLLYAESELPYGFEIPIPQFVKDELNIWVDYIQCNTTGGSGYDSDPCGWNNILKTGNLLFEMAFVGDTKEAQRVQDAVAYIVSHWDDANQDPGWKGASGETSHYQAIYCAMKGFEVLRIDEIDGIDWEADFSDALVAQQNPDGSWSADYWGDEILGTEWALLALEKIAPPAPKPEPIPQFTPIGVIALLGMLVVFLASWNRSVKKKR